MAPKMRRRLASMLYECVLLFGVLFVAVYLYETLLQAFKKDNPALYEQAQTAWVFLVLGAYFIWCWLKSGQTLPMKTWHIRVVSKDGIGLTPARAAARYLASWLMFLPGSAIWYFFIPTKAMSIVLPGLNFLIWMLIARFDRERQFLHDRLAGTRLVVSVGPAGYRQKNTQEPPESAAR